ncbi:MAG TPA: hypothetical protein VLX12_08260 [Syntrophorhabdales bacterium]|nr:hypothetical protein [Syntrophorhabdales bacterium]
MGMVRNRYFEGKLLSGRDLQDEQKYHIEKRKLHNRCLHGYGVACGLDVSILKGMIRVSPGLALACTGDEIVVDERLEISLPETRSSAYLTIRYQERGIDPVPLPATGGIENSRIEETFEISFQAHDPCHEHARAKSARSRALGCGKGHPIAIAKLTHGKEGWRIDHDFQPPRVGGSAGK